MIDDAMERFVTNANKRVSELEAETWKLRAAVDVLARWCAGSLDDMMPGYVCENQIASAAVRAAKEDR